jgi:hypothetical protein
MGVLFIPLFFLGSPVNSNVSKDRDVMKSKAQAGNRRGRAVICVTKWFAAWNAAIRACRS